MRVILDESVPRQLAPLLTGHSVTTVPAEGWAGLTNGVLLARAAERFDAVVTGDQSMQYQQDISGLDLGLIVLVAPNNRVETITAMSAKVLEALAELRPGRAVTVAG